MTKHIYMKSKIQALSRKIKKTPENFASPDRCGSTIIWCGRTSLMCGRTCLECGSTKVFCLTLEICLSDVREHHILVREHLTRCGRTFIWCGRTTRAEPFFSRASHTSQRVYSKSSFAQTAGTLWSYNFEENGYFV